MESSFENIPSDAPLRLSIAAKLAFPDGSMTASGLRREGKRGRLEIVRVAGKQYTSLEAIKRMIELCREPATEVACGNRRGDIEAAEVPHKRSETLMATAMSPQDALRARLRQSLLQDQKKS